jgi:hypothetical protein
MSWRSFAKDDAWKRVTLAHVAGLGQRVWIRCACGRERVVEMAEFSAETGVPMTTPLLAIALRMRCTRCGERKVKVAPEPYAIGRINLGGATRQLDQAHRRISRRPT